jgi:hypothetical protein
MSASSVRLEIYNLLTPCYCATSKIYLMRHLIFPNHPQAEAFIHDLQGQGLARMELGHTPIRYTSTPTSDITGTPVMPPVISSMTPGMSPAISIPVMINPNMPSANITSTDMTSPMVEGTPEDAAAGAVKGTGIGIAVGAVAGIVATLATGGLAALPVILGMAALGSGVGAGVGAVGGASGVEETDSYSSLSDDQYDHLNRKVASGSYVLAIDDTVPEEAVISAATRHGGEFL